MKTFLALLSDKQPSLLNEQLLASHINYLKQLSANNQLLICGPFTDNVGAVLAIKASSQQEAEKIIEQDPFVRESYYKTYVIHEFMLACDANNWLADTKQTKNNLK